MIIDTLGQSAKVKTFEFEGKFMCPSYDFIVIKNKE